MFCSRRSGSESMYDAWARPTKAPDAGKSSASATRRTRKLGLTPASASIVPKTTPPPRMRRRLFHTSPRMPMAGSTTWPNMEGALSSTPICT